MIKVIGISIGKSNKIENYLVNNINLKISSLIN